MDSCFSIRVVRNQHCRLQLLTMSTASLLHSLIVLLFLGLSTCADGFHGPSSVTTPSFQYGQRSTQSTCYRGKLSRNEFPSDFAWGCSTSAYQVEGGVDERGTCTWDTECAKPGKILDGSTGNVTCDSYHKYKEDVDILQNIGFNAYRFSISWARIYPEGVGVEPNQAGVDYYNNLIDELLRKGIQPWITLYHFDLPQVLVDKYDGWTSRRIISDFSAYAETCFRLFGDRVTRWITINEPAVVVAANSGYRGPEEDNTPQRRFKQAHNILLAHAAVVKIYREKYWSKGGMIGISLDVPWYEPLTNSTEDVKAAETAMKFRCGWFLDPLVYGHYPKEIRAVWGKIVPEFTAEERETVKGALDFAGVSHYLSYYVSSKPAPGLTNKPIFPVEMPTTIYVGAIDSEIQVNDEGGGGEEEEEEDYPKGQGIYPPGLEKFLLVMKAEYKDTLFVITENGYPERREENRSLEDYLNDEMRIKFYHQYLHALLSAYKKGANVGGLFAYSILDSFEFTNGKAYLFGLTYVDFDNKQKRYLKASAYWFKQYLSGVAEVSLKMMTTVSTKYPR